MNPGRRLPYWVGPPLFGALLSGLMSLLVSGVATFRAMGLPPDFTGRWISAWFTSWPVAFAAVLFLAPVVRRFVGRLVEPPASASHAPAPQSHVRRSA